MKKTKPAKRSVPGRRDDDEQSRVFIKAAREHGADETTSRADELLRKLAKMAPEPRKSSKKSSS